eukprot:Hpha_TRINITY_DN3558_c0_g1::TRINITY_DN3558_c0_g1_i1::g.25543::m.25543
MRVKCPCCGLSFEGGLREMKDHMKVCTGGSEDEESSQKTPDDEVPPVVDQPPPDEANPEPTQGDIVRWAGCAAAIAIAECFPRPDFGMLIGEFDDLETAKNFARYGGRGVLPCAR